MDKTFNLSVSHQRGRGYYPIRVTTLFPNTTVDLVHWFVEGSKVASDSSKSQAFSVTDIFK